MSEFGDFSITLPYEIDFTHDDVENFDPSIFDEPFELEEELQTNLIFSLNEPIPFPVNEEDEQKTKRFKSLNEEDLVKISEQRYSKSTKKNTKWGYNTFTGRFIHSFNNYNILINYNNNNNQYTLF
jgi:hypothetical protein